MNKVLLIILDGWGVADLAKDNAIAHARKPNFDDLWNNYPHTILQASGTWVGLPEGQIGSSEVGHTIIGAGRNVPQLSTTITEAIRHGNFFKNQPLLDAFERVKNKKSKLHLMGLTSDGGVHSHWEHFRSLILMAKDVGLKSNQLCFHAILDGRDVGPKSAKTYLNKLKSDLSEIGVGRIASICGRYWAMDRDKRWDRTAKAYHAYVLGEGAKARDPEAAIGDNYFAGKTDEFIEPTLIYDTPEKPVGLIEDGDSVVFFNFRADRARQLARALSDKNFQDFERKKFPNVHLVCMTNYDATLNLPVAFAPDSNQKERPSLPRLLSDLNIPQFRIAETEKYAHVTYFFNGGQEKPFPGEERVVVPSPKVSTYDQTPEMSAKLITEALLEHLADFPFVVCNYSNADMVGHTGIFEAAKKACEFVDECLGRVLEHAAKLGFYVIVTADHGNSEKMCADNGEPNTAHTTNPVPFILYNKNKPPLKLKQNPELSLRDIAPTIWELFAMNKTAAFEGGSLIEHQLKT